MKKILVTTFFVLVNFSVSAIACDFHEGGFFSRYDWPRVSLDHSAINDDTNSSLYSSDRRRPDFRYTNTTVNDNSKEELAINETENQTEQ